MSPWLTYLFGLVTLPLVAAAWVAQHELRATGRQTMCSRHGWSSGPIHSTPCWKVLLRDRVHAIRYHRHGVRYDNR